MGLVLVMAGLGAALLPATWIEQIAGVEPDGGSTSLEVFIAFGILAVGASLLAAAYLRSAASRRREPEPGTAGPGPDGSGYDMPRERDALAHRLGHPEPVIDPRLRLAVEDLVRRERTLGTEVPRFQTGNRAARAPGPTRTPGGHRPRGRPGRQAPDRPLSTMPGRTRSCGPGPPVSLRCCLPGPGWPSGRAWCWSR